MTDSGTPGPWHVSSLDDIGYDGMGRIILTAKGEGIALIPHLDNVAAIHEANAHRIAAVPDLVAALEVVLADCAMPTATHLNMVQHALAKARGETP